MSDIFREVDEDLRREQYKKLWERFGSYVIGLAVLIVVVDRRLRGLAILADQPGAGERRPLRGGVDPRRRRQA